MTTDPIADMLTRIKNGYMARKQAVSMPYSTVKENILRALEKKGYVTSIKKETTDGKSTLSVSLVYDDARPALTEVIRVSKPGVRIYTKKTTIPYILGGLGTVIVSTPKGILTGDEARMQGVGGEIICKVW